MHDTNSPHHAAAQAEAQLAMLTARRDGLTILECARCGERVYASTVRTLTAREA